MRRRIRMIIVLCYGGVLDDVGDDGCTDDYGGDNEADDGDDVFVYSHGHVHNHPDK